MTAHETQPSRAQFGTLDARNPAARALDALGAAVPALERRLGFPLSVTAAAQPDGFIWAEVLIPDKHYTAQNRAAIRAALRGAAQPLDVFSEITPSGHDER